MKRYIIPLCLLAVMFPTPSCSDIGDDQRNAFIKFYGSYQGDFGKDVVALLSGGYAVTGTSNPDTVPQMVLIRTDEFGNQLEESPSYYGGDYGTAGNVLLQLDDGFLIGGTLTDSLPGAEFETDAFLVRTDAAGQEIWTRRYGNDEDDNILHMSKRTGGGFVCVGKKTTGEQEDVWIFMVDEQGNLLHEFTGSDLDDDDEANFVYSTGFGYLVGCTYDEGAYEGTDYFVIFLDDQCNIISTTVKGSEDDDRVRAIVPLNDRFLLLGYTELAGNAQRVIGLYSFDIEGNRITNVSDPATISISGADLTGERCVLNATGQLVIAGTVESNENRNMMLMFLDAEELSTFLATPSGSRGNLDLTYEIKEFGELGNQTGSAVKNTPGGGLILVGSNGLEGNSVISLVRTNARGAF